MADHSFAYRALVQAGAIFSDRPQELSKGHVFNSNHHDISTSPYGPNWRLFRRNMAATIHPVRLNAFSSGRQRVIGIFVRQLLLESKSGGIEVADLFRHAVFKLLFLMCFGETIEDGIVREVEQVQRKVLMSVLKHNVVNIWPKLGRIIFWRQRKELIRIREEQDSVLIPR
ncbi:cytochrome P450 89A9-like [Apium graveolens]|uniref:cytochrome P450 89A9-like n=1 Tax=Apium graveolens TaxID=4045 RepID=UPI003D78D1BC